MRLYFPVYRVFNIVFVVLLYVALTACGGSNTDTSSSAPGDFTNVDEQPTAPETSPTEPDLTDPSVTEGGGITDLRVASPHDTTLTLRWSAPTLEGKPALAYDIKMSKRRIRSWMWNEVDAISINGLSVPGSPGTDEEITITGLQSNTTYYFTIRATYADGVVSQLSNLAAGSTLHLQTGRDIFVDTNSPAGGNGSQANPYNTINAACAASGSGDVIRVLGGVYRQDRCSVRSDTAIVSEDGPQKAVIDGEGQVQHLIAIYGDDNVVIDGFELRNSGGGSDGNDIIWIDGAGVSNGSHNIILRRLYVHNAGSVGDCIKVTNYVYDFVLENSRLHSAWGPASGEVEELLDMKLTTNATIRYNWFHHLEGERQGAMAYSKTDSRNIVFENNIFGPQSTLAQDSAVGGGWSSSSAGFNTDGLIIRNNLFFKTHYSAVGAYGARNEFIYNNVIYNSGRGEGGILRIQEGGSQDDSENLYFINNIIVDTEGLMPQQIVSKQSIANVTTFEHLHNLYWNNGSKIPADSYIDPSSTAGFIEGDPEFISTVDITTNYDFDALIDSFMPATLLSPAIDSGLDSVNEPAVLTSKDILGTSRPLGSGQDRGIFESRP